MADQVRVKWWLWLGACLAVFSGCLSVGSEESLSVSVEQESWDEASVHWQIDGASAEARLEAPTIVLFDSEYDTLYAGSDSALSIPDASLGSRERLLVEVCGMLGEDQLCGQHGFAASPKRITTPDIDMRYPIEPTFTRGQYKIPIVVERRMYEDEAWEALDVSDMPEVYLLASVENSGAPVRVPLSPHRSSPRSFDVSRHAHYDDFAFYLRSELQSSATATVSFDVRAAWRGKEEQLTQRSFEVHQRTREDREQDLRYFVQQAAEQLITRLSGDDGAQRARVLVDRWSYDRINDKYEAEVEIRWRTSRRRSRTNVLHGVLEANEAGSAVQFRAERASRRARDRWRSIAGAGDALRLDPLQTELERKVLKEMEEPTPADSLLPTVASSLGSSLRVLLFSVFLNAPLALSMALFWASTPTSKGREPLGDVSGRVAYTGERIAVGAPISS